MLIEKTDNGDIVFLNAQQLKKAAGAIAAACIAMTVPIFVIGKFSPPDITGYIYVAPFAFLFFVGIYCFSIGLELLKGQKWQFDLGQSQIIVTESFMFNANERTFQLTQLKAVELAHCTKDRDERRIAEWHELSVSSDHESATIIIDHDEEQPQFIDSVVAKLNEIKFPVPLAQCHKAV